MHQHSGSVHQAIKLSRTNLGYSPLYKFYIYVDFCQSRSRNKCSNDEELHGVNILLFSSLWRGGGVRAEFKTLRVLSRKGGSYIDFVPTLAKTLRLFRCAPNPSVLDSTPVHVQCTGVRPRSRVDRCIWVLFHTIRGCYYLESRP